MKTAAAPNRSTARRGGGTPTPPESRGAAIRPGTLPLAIANRNTHVNTNTAVCAEQADPQARREAVLAQLRRERARRQLALDAIEAHLREQPSARSIRACARRWCTAITFLADDVIAAQNGTENPE